MFIEKMENHYAYNTQETTNSLQILYERSDKRVDRKQLKPLKTLKRVNTSFKCFLKCFCCLLSQSFDL